MDAEKIKALAEEIYNRTELESVEDVLTRELGDPPDGVLIEVAVAVDEEGRTHSCSIDESTSKEVAIEVVAYDTFIVAPTIIRKVLPRVTVAEVEGETC